MSTGVNQQETMLFAPTEDAISAKMVLKSVSKALKERGYDPVDQLVGYLLSGDPTYITSFGRARDLIRSVKRDDLLEEIVRGYLNTEGRSQGGQTSD
jgi:uncharacterized protein (UPF0297 family)